MRSFIKRELNQNLSGNEVHYTNSLISQVKNMLCSKLHCQKELDLVPCSYTVCCALHVARHARPTPGPRGGLQALRGGTPKVNF
jgi:hypothetical protein